MNGQPNWLEEWDPIEDAVYFDTAAHAVMPRVAVAAVAAAVEANRQPYRIDDVTFFDVADGLRSTIATLIGGSAQEVALTTGASTGLQVLALHLGWSPGDEIIIAGGDFPLQYAVWKPMEERAGALLKVVPPRDGVLLADDVVAAITKRTRVVSLGHARFDTGALLDVAPIAAACRASGAWFVLDISQSCGAVPIAVSELGADVVVCAGYKWLLAPYGTGFLWIDDARLDELLPGPFYWTGQSVSDFASLRFDRPEPSRDAKRFDAAESATQLNLNLAAFRASIDLVARIGADTVLRHGLDLIDTLFAQLPPHCVPASPLDHKARGAFGSFTAGSAEATAALHEQLRQRGIFVSLRQGKIRVAPHLFNSPQQIGMLIDALHGRIG
ncbi:MAG TPA: aminotransferase class V-fold PLP-dependent enzyme [Thermoanaerobaculia bacterium]|nr:aminotransferase class V-fold PLP-dependent enzyme [Thermoanaerobaculia bacterium]